MDAVTDWEAVREAARALGDSSMEEYAENNLRGSGARYNAGKPPLELIPLGILAQAAARRLEAPPAGPRLAALAALNVLARFQVRLDGASPLYDVLDILGRRWEDCAYVFDYGRKKYAAWNWAKGMPWSIPIGCAARHLLAMTRGEINDPESGLPHVGHVTCNIVMLLWYLDAYPEGDDRRVEPLKAAA